MNRLWDLPLSNTVSDELKAHELHLVIEKHATANTSKQPPEVSTQTDSATSDISRVFEDQCHLRFDESYCKSRGRGISVIICSHNGAQRLSKTLQHLSAQRTPPGLPWELIVVDNNSTDHTAEVAEQEWKTAGGEVTIQIICESKAGVAHARECGVNAARYEYIIFCDDDNWLAPDYLSNTFQLLESNPSIGAAGGRSEASADVPFPEWFSGYSFGYAIGTQAEESGDVSSRGFVWGAGMCIRRSLLRGFYERGYRPLLSGRKGEKLLAGEDSEICRWLLLDGHKLWYDSRLKFTHYIPEQRLTEEYRDGIFHGFALSQPVLRAYDQVLSDRQFQYRPSYGFAVGTLHLLRALFAKSENRQLHLTRAQLRFGRRLKITQPLYEILRMVSNNRTGLV